MVLYQANLARIIVVYSDLKYVKCFQLRSCELNEETAKRLKVAVTEELKSHRIGHIYFSYSIYKHHDVETLSYIVKNFEIIKFCGLNMHSKGAYLLDSTSVDFQIEKCISMCLVDFLAAVLAQVNTSSSYLSMLPEKVKEETKINLSNISTVKVLDLTNNNMSDCIADDINLILSYNELEEVYLGKNNLQEVSMIKIAEALQSNTVLKVFDISNNNLNNTAVNSIAAILANKTILEELYLNENKLQAEGIIKIVKKLQSTSLKIFDVSKNNSDSTAASTIANVLILNTQLEELHVGGNILQTKGVIEISLALANIVTLTVFDVSNNDINSEAASYIVYVISRQVKLEKIILDGNNLQDGLVGIVQELKCYSALKVLDISNNRASTTTIDKIAIFLCFQTKLEKLYLVGNNMVNVMTLQVLQYFLASTAFDIPCTNTSDKMTEDVQKNVVFRHLSHLQILFLTHNVSANEYDVFQLAGWNKSYKAKILRSAGKWMCV